MIIDFENGQINVKNSFFKHNMTFMDSLQQAKKFDYEVRDFKNGYKCIYFKTKEIKGYFFHIGLCFKDDFLDFVDFRFLTLEELKNDTWDNWSEEKELKKKERYENWLDDSIGSNRQFIWGKTVTYYDSKGGSSGILIKYK